MVAGHERVLRPGPSTGTRRTRIGELLSLCCVLAALGCARIETAEAAHDTKWSRRVTVLSSAGSQPLRTSASTLKLLEVDVCSAVPLGECGGSLQYAQHEALFEGQQVLTPSSLKWRPLAESEVALLWSLPKEETIILRLHAPEAATGGAQRACIWWEMRPTDLPVALPVLQHWPRLLRRSRHNTEGICHLGQGCPPHEHFCLGKGSVHRDAPM